MSQTTRTSTARQPVGSARSATPVLDRPSLADGASIHALIAACPPLDLNSTYAYLLLCHHHAATCVVARDRGRILGFVSAYRPPADPSTLFVWQVAVHADARGLGLGRSMLAELLAREGLDGVQRLETTVSPSNAASLAMFRALARDLDAPCVESGFLTAADFGSESHEEETLLRIGPFAGLTKNRRVQ